MSSATASIRELRTDFRGVKRKIEQYGQVTITDNGEPSYILKPLPRRKKKAPSEIDYYARLISYDPKPMSAEATAKFWEDERGDR